MKKHFSQEDVEALKKAEQQGGCVSDLVSTAAVFGLIFMVLAAILSYSYSAQPGVGVAVAVQATAILGPTELVLVDTPTLAPTATPLPAILVATPATLATPSSPPPTYTPLPTYTPEPSYTPAATFTPFPTWTPSATWTAVPMANITETLSDYALIRTTLTRLNWLIGGLIILALIVLVFSRPADRDLKRLQRLIEMHLLTGLRPSPPAPALLPAPVRTIPVSEYRRTRSSTPNSASSTPSSGVSSQENSADTDGVGGSTRVSIHSAAGDLEFPFPLDAADLPETEKRQIVLDAWRILDGNKTGVCMMLYGRKGGAIWDYVTEVLETAVTA